MGGTLQALPEAVDLVGQPADCLSPKTVGKRLFLPDVRFAATELSGRFNERSFLRRSLRQSIRADPHEQLVREQSESVFEDYRGGRERGPLSW